MIADDAAAHAGQATRFAAYWARRAQWLKAYTDIARSELKAAMRKRTNAASRSPALCSVSYIEAVELGIDNLEPRPVRQFRLRHRQAADLCPTSWLQPAQP